MSHYTKVTMNLTDRDVENTEKLRKRLHTSNNAEAVSAALSITSSLSELLQGERQLVLITKKGEMEKVIIPGLTD